MKQIIVVGFNTEAFAPEDIAWVSKINRSYEDAVKAAFEMMDEDGFWTESDYLRMNEEGRCSNPEGHRGYYIQGLI